MCVEDAIRIGIVDRFLEDRAEACHRDQLDAVIVERVDHAVCVRDPIEPRGVIVPLDQLDRDPRLARDVERAARAVGEYDHDGDSPFEDRAQVGAASRRKDTDTHASEPRSLCARLSTVRAAQIGP